MSAESQRQGVQTGEQQWLVRSAENQISGPFSLEQVRGLIEQGKLQLVDEICNAHSYWFYLHEAEEVRSQLGIEVPQHLYTKNVEEATETQTDATDLARAEAGATRMAGSSRPAGRSHREASKEAPKEAKDTAHARELPELPELDGSIDDIGENTAVMSNRAFRDYRHKKSTQTTARTTPQTGAPAVAHLPSQPSTLRSASPIQQTSGPASRRLPMERSKILQILAYVLMVGAVVLVIAVIKLLQQPPA